MQKVIVYYAFKIIDGLFVGNSKAPLERDFLIMNKINYIINCAASELTYNGAANILSFDWKDTDDQLIVTIENIVAITQFIDQANEHCEGVLFFSLKGQSRALTALTAYIMFKFNWSLFKTLQFLNSRRKDFEIRAAFLKQLMTFETECFKDKNISRNWDPSNDLSDVQILQNTYLNSLQQQPILMKTLTSLGTMYIQKKAIAWSNNLVQQIESLELKEPKKNIEYKSILKLNKIQQAKQQHRSISVSDHQKNSFEDFILQNLLTTKKLQTPKINSFGFEQKNKKQFFPGQVLQPNRVKTKLSCPKTPERKRLIQNTQQILDTYLNSNINFVRGRSVFTPSKEKERVRALSQQTPSPNRTPIQTKQNIDNMTFIRWSQVKRQAQFKIK